MMDHVRFSAVLFHHKKTLIAASAASGIFVALNIIQDLVESGLKDFSFYLSESALFSSFWLIFVPLLFAQNIFLTKPGRKSHWFLLVGFLVPVLSHALLYPGIVWLISALFYEHCFAFGQTLAYELSAFLPALMIPYAAGVFYVRFFSHSTDGKKRVEPVSPLPETMPAGYPDSLIIKEGSKTFQVAYADVLFFSARSPYVQVATKGRNFLHNDTLKAVLEKTDPGQFIRIHKSTIVNLHMVDYLRSRLNGDYDLVLKNGTELRLSRSYAAGFKQVFYHTHQDGTESHRLGQVDL